MLRDLINKILVIITLLGSPHILGETKMTTGQQELERRLTALGPLYPTKYLLELGGSLTTLVGIPELLGPRLVPCLDLLGHHQSLGSLFLWCPIGIPLALGYSPIT